MASMQICLRASIKRYFSRTFSTSTIHELPRRGDKVVVGMSGGVDSSVTAALLAKQDLDLSAVFMRNWDSRDESGSDQGCEWEKDWEDVQLVCRALDIPARMIDLSQQYWNRVFEPALKVWEAGQTPNPDVWCNKEIKFGALLERLPDKDSTSWFATGHYARKGWTDRPQLLRSKDRIKDQSYYLSSITESGLSRALFPLGDYLKSDVRELARSFKLPTAERSESMGLCFVGERTKFGTFLSSYLPASPGPVRDLLTGKVVAQHEGLWNFTIGQNARVKGMPEKMFVAHKDNASNSIYVVAGSKHPALYCKTVRVSDWRWIWENWTPTGIDSPEGRKLLVRIRHRMTPVPCTVFRTPEDDSLTITFDEPLHGVAEGQVAALWDDEWCLGCGVIDWSSRLKEYSVDGTS